MYYQTTLAALNDHGAFLHAIHFDRIVRPDDFTRETDLARFDIGHLRDLRQTESVADLFTQRRLGSLREQSYYAAAMRTATALLEGRDSTEWERRQWREHRQSFRHAVALAGRDQVWIPRQILLARGLALIGFDTSGVNVGDCSGALRLIDLRNRRICAEQHAAPPDFDTSAQLRSLLPGEQHALAAALADEQAMNAVADAMFSALGSHVDAKVNAKQLGYPQALAADGRRALYFNAGQTLDEYQLLPTWARTARLSLDADQAFGSATGWVLLHDGHARLVPYGEGRVTQTWALPAGLNLAGAVGSVAGHCVAIPGPRGRVVVLHLADGRQQVVAPHPGACRLAMAALALSPDGQQLASVLNEQLVITQLATGRSARAGTLRATHTRDVHGDRTVHSVITPAVAWIADRWLVSDRDGLRTATVEAEHWTSEPGRPGARIPVAVTGDPAMAPLLQATLGPAADAVLPHLSPAVRLAPVALGAAGWLGPEQPGAPPLGRSRLGGWPDLPAPSTWPYWCGIPMAFVAQIDLAEARAICPGLRLPHSGLLSFFMGCHQEQHYPMLPIFVPALGSELAHRGGWQVRYSPDTRHLQRMTLSTQPMPEMFEPHVITFEPTGHALPDADTLVYPRLGLGIGQRDDYEDILEHTSPRIHQHQLMGYPQPQQRHGAEWHAALAYRGLEPEAPLPESDPRHATLLQDATEWGLLLQLCSDEGMGFNWGGGIGQLTFYGPRAAMAAGDFSQVWVVFDP